MTLLAILFVAISFLAAWLRWRLWRKNRISIDLWAAGICAVVGAVYLAGLLGAEGGEVFGIIRRAAGVALVAVIAAKAYVELA